MIKENIIKCENCGKSFNNYYKKTRWRKIACSRECARILRRKFQVLKNKERRHKLREEHRCIICGRKVKPIIVYPQYCFKHKPKSKKEKAQI